MHRIKSIIAVSLVCLSASAASAQITFDLVPVSIPAGTQIVDGVIFPAGTPGPVLGTIDGYVCQDLVVDTTTDWAAAAMLIELTDGSLYQENEGFVYMGNGTVKFYNGQSFRKPDPSAFATLPSSEYDTYVHGNGQQGTAYGAAGDVHGDVQQFDTTEIDVSWSGPSWITNDIGSVALSRVTLSDDATGIWRLKVTQADDLSQYVVTGTITNGVLAFDP